MWQVILWDFERRRNGRINSWKSKQARGAVAAVIASTCVHQSGTYVTCTCYLTESVFMCHIWFLGVLSIHQMVRTWMTNCLSTHGIHLRKSFKKEPRSESDSCRRIQTLAMMEAGWRVQLLIWWNLWPISKAAKVAVILSLLPVLLCKSQELIILWQQKHEARYMEVCFTSPKTWYEMSMWWPRPRFSVRPLNGVYGSELRW